MVTTMHAVKGLEYKVVFVTGLSDDMLPGRRLEELPGDERDERLREEANLIYVAMTRAGEWLYLTYSGQPSRFLSYLERDDFRLEPNMKLRPFLGDIRQRDYFFAGEVEGTPEEKVRQWILRELALTYGYPKEQISQSGMVRIEHPIARGRFRVDIAVGLVQAGEFVSKVIVETKRPGWRLGLAQLEDYMRHCPSAVLGFWTDGYFIRSLMRKNSHSFKPWLGDIPTPTELHLL